jgi:F-type H+-transporting ATPase subunit delta
MAAVTSRYARAFADVVLAHKLDAGQVRQQLASLLAVLQSSLELRRVWENPAIPVGQKIKLLDAIASRLGFLRPVRNFAAVLIQHRRIGQLQQISQQFERELNQRLGIAEAKVTSARELGPEERRILESQIERLTGKKVQARYGTDRSLLGGAVIRIGSTIYDGSVLGQLEKMKEELRGW